MASCTGAGRARRTASTPPAGGGLRAQILRNCHDGPLEEDFGRAKTGSLAQRLAFWVGQDVDVAEYVRSCQTCQRTKAEHGGPRSLLHPLCCLRGEAGCSEWTSSPGC